MSEEQEVVKSSPEAEMYNMCTQVGRSVIAVIDTVTQRGGFRGEELSTIGRLRDQAVQLIQVAEAYHSDS